MATALTSASGFISLLKEPEEPLQIYALENLNSLVDEFWAEISDSIEQIEVLNENEHFKARELAALVASKVYYHIGDFKAALIYALAAGTLFDITNQSLYTKTLVAKCIDEYIRQKTEATSEDEPEAVPIKDLEKVVEKVFRSSLAKNEHKYALGIALESRRLDWVEEIIRKSPDTREMLDYTFQAALKVVTIREFRQKILKVLVNLYRELGISDWIRVCQIQILLDDSEFVGKILSTLLFGSDEELLIALQIAFDLCETSSQQFRREVYRLVVTEGEVDTEQEKIKQYYEQQLKDKENKQPASSSSSSEVKMETDKPSTDEKKVQIPRESEEGKKRLENMKAILSGKRSTNLYLQFLHRNNKTDRMIMKNMKTTLDSKSSVIYSSLILCHAFSSAGTTDDSFLRDNLEWLRLATNWSKFTATAGLGVIQKGHFENSKTILAPYLPQSGSSASASSSPYSEGGALYALGLIHANHGEEITDYLKSELLSAGTNEIVQHGACLGLGVAAMATRNFDVFEQLKNVLFTDSAVAGEAAGMAMGLVMLGSASARALDEMLAYAHDTQHEKIIRGLAIGVALVMCGREEEADTLIEQLVMEKDPILRYGGMYTIALAYAGTANNKAIRKLLHVAVSDVSDDVRRAAVIAIGFLLAKQPKRCPKLVNLLAESYNPHVRYGATLAIGISCAGTALSEAIELLEPLANSDPVDFVRQGALIALSMILTQTSNAEEPKVEKIRKMFNDKINDKHEDIMAKFGACLATGIIDAGGRNCTVSLLSGNTMNHTAIVGMAVFTQYWYWHPLALFLSLAFSPTAIIGLNKDSKMPHFTFKSNVRPSLFAYPEKIQPPVVKAPQKLKAAELSISKRTKIRQKKKGGDLGDSSSGMQIDEEEKKKKEEEEKAKEKDEKEKEEKAKKEKEEKEKKEKEKEKEADFEILKNPARVTHRQRKYITFDVDDRYTTVKSDDLFGIVVLKDSKPDLPEEFVAPSKPKIGGESTLADEEDEPAPPQPFEFDPEKERD